MDKLNGHETLNELCQYIKEMKVRRNFNQNLERELVLLAEEFGELSHEICKCWKNDYNLNAKDKENMAFEIVDCLIFLLSISNMVGIEDLMSYFVKKEEYNKKRFEG